MRAPPTAAPLLIALGLAACHRAPARPTTPIVAAAAAEPTPRRPVVDRYHGVAVTDDYQWLEDTDAPEVRAWVAAQNRRTRAALDPIAGREAIERQLTTIFHAPAASYARAVHRGGRLFAMRSRPGGQQPFLVVMPSADERAAERVVLDPNTLDPSGQTAIDLFAPSHDGRRVAVALARNGSEVGALHIYDVETGRELGDTIERVSNPTGGGSLAWAADNAGVYYTRYPREGERPAEDMAFFQQVYFHALGADPATDRYELGRESPRIAETELSTSADGRYLLAAVANGDGGEFAHYLRDPGGAWRQITRFEDGVTAVEFGPDALFLTSHRGAPRGAVLRLPLAATSLSAATVVVPQSDAVIEQVVPTATRLYVVDLVGGPSQVRVFDHAGHPQGALALAPVSSVRSMVHTTGDAVLFRAETYLTAPAWYRAGGDSLTPTVTAMRDEAPVSFDDAEVVRELATSRDGTSVPVMVIRRRGTALDGNNPTLLGGYGGYGVSMTPSYSPTNRLWLDRGGVVAVAILRGGGEFGEDWHRGGNLTHKQNVFDDFIAAAERLIALRYTAPERLAIRGRSNGGLLMGAAFTQRPELFRAVYAGVGIYDMLRVERDPNGAFNVTEFGSVRDADQFRALHAYSPYHHVTDGAAYPAVLLTTGEHDGRVNPAHSRKMAARLQAASAPGRPVLLRVSARSGHGMGSSRSEVIAEQTDVWAFLFEQLGMRAPQ
ncbi:MAG: prolyl oligopeptidase family serine peptidase [Myxococcales bacterium]|nr:prolyl oligopeptidase family serine peptidase [Myxococcales bacterium]